jgi:hypothetical protein
MEEVAPSGALHQWLFSKMLCGCGNPQSVVDLLYKWLMERKDGNKGFVDEGNLNDHPGYWYAFAYYLDYIGLIEHGGYIGGYWLSQSGKRVLAALEKHGTDFEKWQDGNDYEVENTTGKWDNWPEKI